MDLRVRVSRQTHELVLAFTGELDIASADELGEALHAFDADGFRHVTLDLSGVSFCDAAGIGALIAAHNAVTTTGGELSLSGLRSPVRRVLDITDCGWLATPARLSQTGLAI